jgi:hypothetical protein
MNIIDDIKEKVSMLDVLQLYGQYPVRGRNNYRCFAHDDRRPSAGLTKQGDKFHCFSCNWTGNIFDVVQFFEKCDMKTAMRILDDKFRLGLYGELSHREKLRLARELKARERSRQEELMWEQYEKLVLADIIKNLRTYEDLEREFRIQKGHYLGGWSEECSETYFCALERIGWLDWLYSAVGGISHPECEWDYIYPRNKRELLKMIKSGEIVI